MADWHGVDLTSVTRRSFLKLAGSSLLSLFWLPLLEPGNYQPAATQVGQISTLGRVLNNRATRREKPTMDAAILERYKMDMVVPITGATLSEDPADYNRIWYEVDNGAGYTYSGGVQPVEVRYNPVVETISEKGVLAEVTVPYTQAFWSIQYASKVTYRMYYGTTHWIFAAEKDPKGKWWYRIHDDKKGYYYYVDATHLRLIPVEEVTPLSPQVPQEEKHIEIRLKEQVVIAYEGDQAVFMARTATGARFRDGDFRTRPGTYMTNRKRASRHMAAGEPGVGTGFDLPGVPWVSYLTESGVSLHGTYWHNDFGSPRSHGCINLPIYAAHWFFRWTVPEVPFTEELVEADTGTRVVIV